MAALKSLAQGFLSGIALIMIINVASLARAGDTWLAAMYLLILLIPATSLLYLKLRIKNPSACQPPDRRWRSLLFSLQGVALAFWMYDLATTFYAINVTHLAYELNPLGWPLGVLGALAYYGPTLLGSYLLLFRINERHALYAAVPLTIVALGMSSMNLIAGAQNFQVFIDTTALASGVRYSLLALIGAAYLTIPMMLKKMAVKKAVLS
jgi:hypothetical protein